MRFVVRGSGLNAEATAFRYHHLRRHSVWPDSNIDGIARDSEFAELCLDRGHDGPIYNAYGKADFHLIEVGVTHSGHPSDLMKIRPLPKTDLLVRVRSSAVRFARVER